MTKIQNNKKEKDDIAVAVEGVSKTFKIPHEKHSTLKQAALNLFSPKSYEVFNALQDVSFEVKKGEFFGIIGKNGSGKSTLLKILARIYTPDNGSIEVNGKLSPFLELGVGFNPELTARENVFLGGAILGLTREEVSEKFDSIIKFAELEEFVDLKFKNYSSGMQVRLAFALAINAHAEILLMDEVLAVGDSNFQAKCLDVFGEYKRAGKTVVLVTHDISTVQRYCDRVMLMRNGKIEKIGDSQEVAAFYVGQNIVDIENKIEGDISLEKIVKKHRNKQVEIKKVDFLDAENKKKNVFSPGEDIIVRIFYKSDIEVMSPVFGVAVFSNDGVEISGPNTRTSDFKIDKIVGEGYIDFIIKENLFFTGTYRLTAGIFNWDCTSSYDFKDREYKFRVQSSERNQNGLVNIKTLWKK